MNKRAFQVLPLILSLMLIFSIPSVFAKDIHPGGPFVQENQHVSYSAIMTFDEVEDELFKLEKRGKDLLKVDIAGYTLEGRPLFIAKIGWGPKKIYAMLPIERKGPNGTANFMPLRV